MDWGNDRGVVNISVRINGYTPYLKAVKGAERSCLKRRSRRGQRHGKRRSRGCHPRSPETIRPSETKEVRFRAIDHHLRGLDHWQDRGDQFVELIRKSKMGSLVGSSGQIGPMYVAWRSRWSALSGHIPKIWRSMVLGPSFAFFISKHLNLKLKGVPTPYLTLNDWAQDIRMRNDANRIEPIRPHKYTVSCTWCKEAWSSPGRSSFCPQCGRACLAPLQRSNARRGRFLSRR